MTAKRFRADNDRDDLLEVQVATRAAIDRAMAPDVVAGLNGGDFRVLLAAVHLLTTWKRLWNYTSYEQVADVARVSRSTAIRSMKKLTTAGVLIWKPGSPGRGHLSKLALPRVERKSVEPEQDGHKEHGGDHEPEPSCEHSDPMCGDCRRANLVRLRQLTEKVAK